MTPRHVLIIVQNLSVPTDRRVWLESLALVAAGFEVTVVCPAGAGEAAEETLDGVRIHRYPPPPEARGVVGYAREFVHCWVWAAVILRRIWREHPFDAIQACNPPDTYWALARLYERRGVRFVFDHHDLCPELLEVRFAGSPEARRLGPLLRWLERRTFATADHVISTNESYRAVAERRGGCPRSKVTIVRSGPDPALMARGEPVPALRRGRRHLCCYLGIMGPQDGVDLLLRAAELLVIEQQRTDIQFALLGFGDCEAELRRTAERSGIADHVTFAGRADGPMIDAYLSTADVGVCPDPLNAFNDASTMNKVLEYMAYELPVVAFDLQETRRSAASAALYAGPDDPARLAAAIADLLADPGRRCEMGIVGRQRIEAELGWHRQAPRYVGVYRRLLGDAEPLDLRDSTLEAPVPVRGKEFA